MKILIISRHTFPKQGPRAFRTAELSEELSRLGHHVVLYSVQGKFDYKEYQKSTGVKMQNIKPRWATLASDESMRYNLLDKFLYHYFHRILFFPEIEFKYLVDDIIEENPGFDLLITIACPHSIHMGAARAKRKYPDLFPKIWIADCGDPFYMNSYFSFPRYMEKWERDWCEQADYISIPIEEGKSGYFPEYHDKIKVIPQGFDFTKTPIAAYLPHEVPTFAYAGALYGKRNPIDFIKYLSGLQKPFRFYLFTRSAAPEEYSRLLGENLINVVGKNRKECIYELSKMDFLVNFTNPSAVQSPSKLIDYGIAKRPIADIHIPFDNKNVIDEFLNRNYSNARQINNLEEYDIRVVAQKFLNLATSE